MKKNVLTGGEVLIKCLERQNVNHIFGLSGGAALPIFDALIDSSIKLVAVRHEQGASHIADGYARASGIPGVVLVTSGPGATNTITGLLTANMDSVPMIVITGQTITSMLGKDAFQEADIIGMTYPVVKHSYMVTNADDIPRIVSEAFQIALSGRPGPVLIDIPKDISQGPCTASIDVTIDTLKPELGPEISPKDVSKVASLLNKANKPVLYVGHGAVISGAGKAILQLAEKIDAPIVNTLLGKGAVDENHPLHLGMLGMHGTAYANKAMDHSDLILSIGARWDDRVTGKISEFCKSAVKIHIDIDKSEINKVVDVDASILGDATSAVEKLLIAVESSENPEWAAQYSTWKKDFPLEFNKNSTLTAQEVLHTLDRLTDSNAIITTDVGQHQMWAAQFCLTRHNRHWLSSGGAGTMGFGFPAAIGAQLACPDEEVWCVVGDGGFQMTFFELATAAIEKLPVKCLIIDNNFLGMIRQWQDLFYDNRLSGSDLSGNPDFVKLAEAYGVKAILIDKRQDIETKLAEARSHDGPVVVVAKVEREDNVFPMIPAGGSLGDMLLERPDYQLTKPEGST